MADISQVKLPNGDTYNLVDETSGYIKSYTDEKVKNTVITEGGTFYLIGSSGASTATESLNKHNAVSVFLTADTSVGDARLILGNSITSGNNQKKGLLRLYGPASYYTDLISGTPSANRTITLPNATGTVALTSDLPTRYTSSNITGYLTMADLPVWDGTVVMS